jgi:hypothetical protein
MPEADRVVACGGDEHMIFFKPIKTDKKWIIFQTV